MKALFKNRNRVLAFIMAVAMVLTVIPMGMAFAEEIVYTVSASKPAIPAKQGKVIDLAKIAVEIGGDTYRGSDLDWSTEDKAGGIIVDNSAKTIAYFGSGIYVAKATNGTHIQNVYILQTDESGVATIYDHKFSQSDLYKNPETNFNDFTPESEWKVYSISTEGNGNHLLFSNGIYTDRGTVSSSVRTVAFYLDPDSVSGKRVADFQNTTIEVNFGGAAAGGNTDVGAYVRFNVNEAGEMADWVLASTYVRSNDATKNGHIRYQSSAVSSISTPVSNGTPVVVSNPFNMRSTIEGDKILSEYDTNANGSYSDDVDLCETSAYTYAPLGSITSGTIGVYSVRNINPKLLGATVTTTLDITNIDEYLSSDFIFIKSNEPALPLAMGSKLDLSSIYFEFNNGFVAPGSSIEWSTDDTYISLDNVNKTVALFGSDVYKLYASHPDVDETKTIFVFQPDSNNSKNLFSYNFSASDVPASASVAAGASTTFGKDNIWKAYNVGSNSLGITWYNDYGLCLDGNTDAYAILDPESEPGKIISSFSNVTVDFLARGYNTNFGTNGSGTLRLLARYNMADTKPALANDTYIYYQHKYGVSTVGAVGYSGNNSFTASSVAFSAHNTTRFELNHKMVLNGDNLTYYVKNKTDAAYTKLYELAEETTADAAKVNAAKATANLTGTVGYYSHNALRPCVSSMSVSVNLSADLIEAIAAASQKFDDYIPSSKPAIAIDKELRLNLDELFFQFNDGSVVDGSNITWSTTDTTNSLSVSDEDKSVILFGNDMYELVANYNGKTKTFYVFTPDADNTKTIFDYTFSASDAGLAVTDSNGVAVWAYSGAGSWGWVNNNSYTTTAPRLRNDGGAGIIYLNPNSEKGKIVSSFADYTFYLTAVTHENWTNPASYTTYFPMLTRYNMAGTSYSLANDTYLGYRAYFTTNGGGVFVGNQVVASSTLTYPYVNSNPHVDYKMQVSGAEIIFSARPMNTGDYTQVFKMSDAAEVPAAVLSTVGKSGTIGVYTDTSNRPSLQKAKVTLDFSAEEIAMIKSYTDELDIITADAPTIPMQSGKTLSLKDIYFEFDSGTLTMGKNITWSAADTSNGILVDDANKTVTLLGSEIYPLKAVYGGEEKIIYVFEPELNNTKILYQHTFSADDLSNGAFTAESDWTNLSTSTISVNSATGGITAGNATAYYTLKPTSEAAKLISSFRNVTMEANLGFTTLYGPAGANFIMGVRANWANNASPSGAPATYVGGGYRTCLDATTAQSNKDYAYTYVSGNASAKVEFTTSYTTANDLRTYKISAIGDTFELYRNNVALGADVTAAQATAIKETKAGNIWFRATGSDRLILKDVIVVAVVADEEIALIAEHYADGNASVISADKPAIPMEADKKAVLSDIYFEFDNGAVAKGENITFDTTDESGNIIVLDADKSVTLRAEGTYPLTAEYAGLTKTFYVTTYNQDNTATLFDYTFSSSDAGTADSNGIYAFGSSATEKPWEFRTTAGAAASWNTSVGGSYATTGVSATVNPGLWIGSTEGYLMLNPDSQEGKLVGSFADLSIVYRATLHPNFVCYNNTTVPIMAKYNLAAGATSPNKANDTYIGYNAPWSNTTKGGIYYSKGKTHVGNAVVNPNYTIVNNKVTEGDLDFKFDFSDGDYSFSVKGADSDDSGYTTLYTLSSDNTAPLAASTAANGKGTFAMYTYSGTRVASQYFKVTTSFSDEEIAAIKGTYIPDNAYILMQSKPVVPIKVDAVTNLNNFMFEMSDGSVKPISKVVLEFEENDDIVYDNENSTLAVYARGMYAATVKLNDADEGVKVYFVTPDEFGDYKIYDHTFSADDISGGNFVADSDWQLLPGSSENPLTVNTQTGGITAGMNTAHYALKPTSEAAKLISCFRDVTMEAQLGFTTLFSQYGYNFIMGVRANWSDNSAPSGTPATYVGGGYRTCLDTTTAQSHKDYAYTYVSGKTSAQVTFEQSYTQANHLRTYKVSAIGDTFELYRDGVALGAAVTADQAAAIKDTKAGYIWFRGTNSERLIIKSVKVSAVFAEEEFKNIESTDIEFDYIVDASGTGDKYSEKVFTSVSDAISYIGQQGGEIKIKGAVTTADLVSASKIPHKDIVITSFDGVAANSTLTITSANKNIYGNITFENITVVPKTEINTGKDYTITFGEGSVASGVKIYGTGYSSGSNVVINSSTVTLPSDYVASYYTYEDNANFEQNVTINTGSHSNFLIGTYANNGMTLNGDLTVILNAGEVNNVYTGHGGTGIGHDTILRGNSTFIMNGGKVKTAVYIDSMSTSQAGRDVYVHNLTYIFNEKTMDNTVLLNSYGRIKHLRDESKWVVILNNAEEGMVTRTANATADVDYYISVNGGTAEPVYTGRTSYDAASNELIGFKFKSDNEAKTKVFVNNKTIVEPDAEGIYDLSIFEGADIINVEFVAENEIVASYDKMDDVAAFREDGYKAPEKAGYVFGGWFGINSETGEYYALSEEEANEATTAYAKFVPEGVLKIAWQLELGTTAETDKADIRFITTIDSFDYRRVEFVMNLGGNDSKPIVSSVGYTTLYGFSDKNLTRYIPEKTFSPESTRFVPALVSNVPNAIFTNESENPLYVTASWITMDGTKVSGEKQHIKFSRSLGEVPKYDQAIVCWGDSITMGLSMGANQNYPDVLNGLIQDDIKVLNAGVGGENSASILSRANLLPTTVYGTVNFAAGQREVAISETALFRGVNGEGLRYVHYVMGNRLSIRKVFIGGQEFELSALPAQSGMCHTYMLRRKGDISAPLTLEPGVEVRFDYSGIYTSTYCNIALIGCNDTASFPLDTLIARYKTIEASADKFIAIVPFYYADYTDRFATEFPGHYVDFRRYVRSEPCFNKYGAELGFSDLDSWNAAWAAVDAQGTGYLISALTENGNVTNVHLSAKGYKIMADLVYAKGVELGYWN